MADCEIPETPDTAKEPNTISVPEILLPNDADEGEEEEDEDEEGGGRKIKLVRSHAIRDSTSPPPRQGSPQLPPGRVNQASDNIGVDQRSIVSGSEGCEGALGELPDSASVSDSGRGDTDTPDESTYTDSTGIDLTQFIISTLNKNTKDRILMLKLESEMSMLVKDTKKNHHKFPQMSSYHRMLVHRVAAYFGLDHNVDQTGNCVIVNKTKTTRLPDMKFREHVPDDLVLSTSEPRRLILKRESCSCDSADRYSDNSSRRSKSIEEREEEYERAKRRIFNDASREHHMQSYKYSVNLGSTKGANQARSFDFRETLRDSAERPQVSKSFSFGGYPAPQHLEPHRQGHKSNPPKFSRGQVVWAVSDIGNVPKGSVLINPDTGTPYLNSDGSVYVFDPGNPPRFAGEEHATPSPHHSTTSLHHSSTSLQSSPSPLMIHQELSKLSLEGGESPMVYGGGWVVQPPRPTPYILVNPVSPLPQYLPYVYPAFQDGSASDMSGAPQSVPVGLPHQAVPHQAPNQAPPAVPRPTTINHIPQNGLVQTVQTVQQGQFQAQYGARPLIGAPVQKPFLFSIHRSPQHPVVIFLQHCPAILSRSQLVSMLDPFLGGRGHIQLLDATSQWVDVNTLPPEAPTTNRYPIQIVFDSEDQASQTIAALKGAGFLMEPQD